MRRNIKILSAVCTAAVMLCALLAGCGKSAGGASSSETPNESVSEQQADTAGAEEQNTEDENRELTMEEQMVVNSLLSTGNNYRMKKAIEKARAGEDITIGFIGGSITEGYNAGTNDIYAKLTYEYFKENFGTGDNIHYVNAGLSGTPSILGLIRSDRDLFKYEPDIVFVEFAVNDGSANIDNTGYESLVYKALTQPNEPAVVLLYSVIRSGYTCQDNMNLITFKYDLPKISVKNAIWSYIESGDYTWEDWSNDDSHPNAEGSRLYADFIINYLKAVDKEEISDGYEVPDAFSNGFDHSKLLMVDNEFNTDAIELESLGSYTAGSSLASFRQGWSHDVSGNDGFCFSFEGDALYIVYKDTKSDAYGAADVYIDGEKAATLYGNSSDGWNNPVTERVYRAGETGKHKVEIKMADGDEAKEFELLCFGVH
ncbi:MAG: SGNH/GDSL hydrolase family protein [Butyrivibrio sp.]|nr:SGNH/GDSL hydrolase family protein [Butyrivibrio sp.]